MDWMSERNRPTIQVSFKRARGKVDTRGFNLRGRRSKGTSQKRVRIRENLGGQIIESDYRTRSLGLKFLAVRSRFEGT